VPAACQNEAGAAVPGAGAAELAEADGVAARLGEEVAAVAEHVRPQSQPRVTDRVTRAGLPGGGDHALVVGRAA
jgi:hypothetical protein